MYTNHVRCRACGYGPALVPEGIKTESNGQKLLPVFNLGLQPLANSFRSEREEQTGFAPLTLLFCPRCSLAQLSVTVKPEILYWNYPYVTSSSVTMQNHFDRLFDDLNIAACESVVEIGSNDGRMLAYWRTKKPTLKVVGIDPARNLAQAAFERNIGTVVSVFNKDAARTANAISPDLVIARHVFCHADDWEEFIYSLALLGHDNTRYVIEVPYVKDVLENVEFDTIYHEHLSYLSLKAMLHLTKKSPLFMDSVNRYPIHGGAIVITLLRRTESGQINVAVEADISEENFTLETWSEFSVQAANRILQLRETIEAIARSKTVCAFGASAKSTVLMRACRFTRTEIKFICDNTKQKQWKFSPGSDIPITDEEALIREQPDYCLITAWNWAIEIMGKFPQFKGKWIVPGKTVEILPA